MHDRIGGFSERLRRLAYKSMNSPPFLDEKYALRHYFSNAQTVANDIRQLFWKKDVRYYRMNEKNIPAGVIFFSVTNVCNARCVFCAYKSSAGPRGIMEFKTFKKAADEYAEMGGRVISFTPTVGEPLLDPGLLKKIRYAVSLKGIQNVQFYTNGILLEKNALYKELVDSGISEIRISTAETSEEGFNKVFGVRAYAPFISGLRKLLEYNKESGEKVMISINFRSSMAPEEVLNTPDFKEYILPYLSDRVMYDFINDYDNWGGTIGEDDLPGVMKLRRIPRMKNVPCAKTFDIAVLFNGKVRLCACRFVGSEFDELVVGDVHEQSLQEIYRSTLSTTVRENFPKRTLPPVCQSCSLYMPATSGWLRHRSREEMPRFHQLPFGAEGRR